MQIKEIQEILNAEVLCGEEFMDTEVQIGCGSDLMSHVLAFVKPDDALLLTGLTTSQVIYIGDAVNIKAICFVRGKRPEDETVELARKRNMVLLTVDLPMFESCGRLYKKGLVGGSEYESEE